MKIRNLIITFFLIIILFITYIYRNNITNYILETFIIKREIITYKANEYKKENNWKYITATDNFFPSTKQEILQVFYTVLNNGWDKFTFYCAKDYTDCQNDVKEIVDDKNALLYLNNFVHPYNSYENINISINNFGEITIYIEKLYSNIDIKNINNKIEEIEKDIITENMNTEDKIKAFHDYIVNNTIYDREASEDITNNITNRKTNSHKATNVLLNGIGLCGGYTDTLAIYLNHLGVKNYKIANDTHVWNFINLNDKWSHIDMTWDDPVTSDNSNLLMHDFFIIDSKKLQELDTIEHNYDTNIYIEAT